MTGDSGQKGVPSHRELIVWQKSLDLVDRIYDLADPFPATEIYALTAQIKRSVSSVPTNIAEGQTRATSRDFAHFLVIARGSLMETETLLTIAVRRKYTSGEAARPAFSLIVEISKMLTVLRERILKRKRQ